MDILMSTRLTPTEKSAKREGYRCPECRNGLKTTAVLTT
jgi:hypothetical protein